MNFQAVIFTFNISKVEPLKSVYPGMILDIITKFECLTRALSRLLKEESQLTETEFENGAKGCIIGAFAADSLGSYNEFCMKVQTKSFMEKCMKMDGGGPFGLAGGQITDDSELAMC